MAIVTKPFRQEKACNLTKVESTNRTNLLSKKKKETPWQGGNYGIGQLCYIRVVLTPKKFTWKCVNREVVTYHKFVYLTFLIMFSCIHTSLDKTKQRGGVNNWKHSWTHKRLQASVKSFLLTLTWTLPTNLPNLYLAQCNNFPKVKLITATSDGWIFLQQLNLWQVKANIYFFSLILAMARINHF